MITGDPRTVQRIGHERREQGLRTVTFGEIVSYDPTTERATIKPLVRYPNAKASGVVEFQDEPDVPDVPVCFPSGGGVRVSWPLPPGAFVILAYLHRDASAFLEALSGPVDPLDYGRTHGAHGSAIAFPWAPGTPLESDPAGIMVTADVVRVGPVLTATEPVAVAAWVDLHLATLRSAIIGLGGSIPSLTPVGANRLLVEPTVPLP